MILFSRPAISLACCATIGLAAAAHGQVRVEMPPPPTPPADVYEPAEIQQPGDIALDRYVRARTWPVYVDPVDRRFRVNRPYAFGYPTIFGRPVFVFPTRPPFKAHRFERIGDGDLY